MAGVATSGAGSIDGVVFTDGDSVTGGGVVAGSSGEFDELLNPIDHPPHATNPITTMATVATRQFGFADRFETSLSVGGIFKGGGVGDSGSGNAEWE